MLAVFDHHERRYGTRHPQVELRENGYRVGRQALRTGLRRHGRKALQPKSFVPRTTDSTHGQRCAPNLLLDQPRPTQANRVWVSDITYLPLANGTWAYLSLLWQVRASVFEGIWGRWLALVAGWLRAGLHPGGAGFAACGPARV